MPEQEGARLCWLCAMGGGREGCWWSMPRLSAPHARCLQDTAAAGPEPGWAGTTQPKPGLLSREKLQENGISSFRRECTQFVFKQGEISREMRWSKGCKEEGARMCNKSRAADAGKRNLWQRHSSAFIFPKLLADSSWSGSLYPSSHRRLIAAPGGTKPVLSSLWSK